MWIDDKNQIIIGIGIHGLITLIITCHVTYVCSSHEEITKSDIPQYVMNSQYILYMFVRGQIMFNFLLMKIPKEHHIFYT